MTGRQPTCEGSRPGGSRPLWLVAAVAVLLAGVGCAVGGSDQPVPGAVPVVQVAIHDEDLSVGGPVPAGRVVFEIHNAGRRAHRLALVPMPEEAGPIEDEVTDEVRRSVRLLARVSTLQAGQTGTFAVDLAADRRYGLLDYSKAPDGTQHSVLGVAGEFHTQGQPAGPQPTAPGSSPSPADSS